MGDKMLLEMIHTKGALKWNQMRKENPDLKPDLRGIVIYGDGEKSAKLNEINFSNADLSNARFEFVHFRRADFSGADLGGLDSSDTNFSGANLREANLRGARLADINFSGADLSGLDLRNIKHISGDFSKVNLNGADLSNLDLRYGNFCGANLREANLSGADLSGANLNSADLSYSNLSGVNLRSSDVSSANLSAANLSGAILNDVNFKSSILLETNLIGVDLSGVNLRCVNLSGADLSGANLNKTDLSEADFSQANFTGTNLKHARLLGTNFRGAKIQDCSIYGISAWDLNLEGTTQKNLNISSDENSITVNDLEVAQFIYLLMNNVKIRNIIDTVTSKVVLILGRFNKKRKILLDSIREKLEEYDYVPVMMDFKVSDNLDLTETITLLARLSKFIIVDITAPKSSPHELANIVKDLPSVPIQPIIHWKEKEYGMFEHNKRFDNVMQPCIYARKTDIIKNLKNNIIDRCEQRRQELFEKKTIKINEGNIDLRNRS